jgi:hypothetical protein
MPCGTGIRRAGLFSQRKRGKIAQSAAYPVCRKPAEQPHVRTNNRGNTEIFLFSAPPTEIFGMIDIDE